MADKNKRSTIAAAALVGYLEPLPDRVTSAWLAERIMALTADGRLPIGATLPSERSLAVALSVSRGTITRTMDLLYDNDMLESKRGSGHRIKLPKRAVRPLESLTAHPEPADDDAIDLRWTVIPPHPLVQECATSVASGIGSITSLGTSHAQGVPELVTAICDHYTRRGLPTDPEQIVVTNGVVSGLHLSVIAATRPSALIAVENPTYPNIMRVASTERRRLAPFDLGDGFPETLATVLQSGALGAAILTPDFHNPTGQLLHDAHRATIARAAAISDTPLIIDESLALLNWKDTAMPHPMVAEGTRTYLVGGTSKSLWAGLRVGWIRTSRRAADMLAHIRLGVDLGAPIIEQLMAADLLSRASKTPAHADMLATQYATLIDALHTHLPHWAHHPADGGLSIWCQGLTKPAHELAALARAHGVELLPGTLFSSTGRDWTHALRIPFTSPARDLEYAIEVLGELDRL